MIPYGKQTITNQDIQAVADAVASPFLTQGPKILEFEKSLVKITGAKYAVAVSNGTAALHLAYLAAGLKKGDEVITTPNTFVATTNMLLAVGAKPVFVDIRKDTSNIDELLIEKAITKKTKAIVPVHFAGVPCEMSTILKLAKKHKLLVIEDACHALGAKYKDKKIGSVGGMTIFSFHPVKSITTGEGGAVVTNNKKFYERIMRLRSHGLYKDKNGFNVMTEMGYNYRLTDMQCALGVSQLTRLSSFVDSRNERVRWYEEELKSNQNIILPSAPKNILSAWHIFVIRVKDPKDRLSLYNFLKNAGIGVNFHYPPVYSHPFYRKNGYKKTALSVSNSYGKTAITLPLYPTLTRKDVKTVCDAVNSFYAK